MNFNANSISMSFEKKWIGQTIVGWISGFIVALILIPWIQKVTGNLLIQSPLSIIMVLVISSLQAVALRKQIQHSLRWALINTFAFAFCCIPIEIISDLYKIVPEIYMPVGNVLAGLLAGFLQTRLFFHTNGKKATQWMVQYGTAWFITIGLIYILPLLSFFSERRLTQFLNTIIILSGGWILGYLTKSIARQFKNVVAPKPVT